MSGIEGIGMPKSSKNNNGYPLPHSSFIGILDSPRIVNKGDSSCLVHGANPNLNKTAYFSTNAHGPFQKVKEEFFLTRRKNSLD
jgi:hypothetical protein